MMLLASVTMETAVHFISRSLHRNSTARYTDKNPKQSASKWKRRNWRGEIQLWWREDLMKGSVCFTGNEAPTSRSLISEFIRPLQISGDKPELLSVKPTFLTRSRAGSPARAFLSEVSDTVCLHPKWIWLHLHFSFYKCMDTKTNELSAAQWPSPDVLTEWSWSRGRGEAWAIRIVPPSPH